MSDQFDLFAGIDAVETTRSSPPTLANGLWVPPESIALSAALQRGELREAVKILAPLSLPDTAKTLLGSGFRLGSARTKKQLLVDVQSQLIAAVRHALEQQGGAKSPASGLELATVDPVNAKPEPLLNHAPNAPPAAGPLSIGMPVLLKQRGKGGVELHGTIKVLGSDGTAVVTITQNSGKRGDFTVGESYLQRVADLTPITKDHSHAPTAGDSMEPDRSNRGAAPGGVQAPDADEPARAGFSAGGASGDAAPERVPGQRDQRVPGADGASGRASHNQPIHRADGRLELAPNPSRVHQRGGGDANRQPRLPADGERAGAALVYAESIARDRLAKQQAQLVAGTLPIILADLDNIRATLPVLLPEQQEDVHKAEQRFAAGHGMMFTNGTGTGKTYTGIGIAKRFAMQGKDSILIVAPSQDIVSGWIAAGEAVGLTIKRLDSINAHGDHGIVATTYANLAANYTLADREWDLVIPDESHKLMQSEDGKQTAALSTLRGITNHPRGYFTKAAMILRDLHREANHIESELKSLRVEGFENANSHIDTRALEARLKVLSSQIEARTKEIVNQAKDRPRSKVAFLSATPFGYHFTIDYAEGYLFSYDKDRSDESQEYRGYNVGGNREQFFMANFGYRMRFNKLTRPKAGVNSEVLEREFHETLKREGALSGRKLTVDADYDRKFILVDSGIGQRIDEAIKYLMDSKDAEGQRKYPELYEFTMKRFDYLSRMRLLEAIKAEHAVETIQQHQALGRKVVVFHDYNSGGGFSPFNYDALTAGAVSVDDVELAGDDERAQDLQEAFREAQESSKAALAMMADRETAMKVHTQIAMLRAERPDILRIDFKDMRSPIITLKAAFPNALIYNGNVPARDRARARQLFNTDGSGFDLMVIQSAAGEAGISLHDTTGRHQRTMINLGMPIRPVTAIQQEGRTYRVGQVTDAVMRYMTTGTGWETATFASKIASRAGTAENLGMGNEARALRQSFIDAYNDADAVPASLEDGKGGKAADNASYAAMSPFERAKTYYYAQQKNTKSRQHREGKDYYSTPEPLGLKMVEFAGLRPFERVLEPSSGHGAIARFLPENTARTLVEPSAQLAPRAAMASPGSKLINSDFESLHIGNKYDAVVMNPPYGLGGSTAIQHVAKAAQHVRNGGRVVALIPRGGSADKRFDNWYEGEDGQGLYMVAEVLLPSVTFENAGTNVNTRIVVLEKQTDPEAVAKLHHPQRIDLSGTGSVEELFDRIEDLTVRERIAPLTQEGMSLDEGDTVVIGGTDFEVLQGGLQLRPKGRLGKDEFGRAAQLARQFKGEYDSLLKVFRFDSSAERDQWAESFDRGDEPQALSRAVSARSDADSTNSTDPAAHEQLLQQLGLSEVTHTTGKGKNLQGYVLDVSLAEAKSIDEYTFKKDGGMFIRSKHLPAMCDFLLRQNGGLAAPIETTASSAENFPADFQDALEGVHKAETVAELQAFCVRVDEHFLNQQLKIADHDWPVFNQTVAVKMALLSQPLSRVGESLAEQHGIALSNLRQGGEGLFTGRIAVVDSSHGAVLQLLGRGEAVVHEIGKLDPVPTGGQLVTIRYQNGWASVAEVGRDRSQGVERG